MSEARYDGAVRFALLLAIGVVACQQVKPLVIDARAGDLIIVADRASGRRVDGARLYIVGQDVLPPRAHAQSQVPLTWHIPRAALVDELGAPLSDDAVRALVVRGTHEPSESACGRCMSPAFRPPQILRSGESCPPPPFAAVGAAATESAGALRIDRPGPCACEPHTPSTLPIQPKLFEVATHADPWTSRLVIGGADGTVTLIGARHAIQIAPDGTRRERFESTDDQPCVTSTATRLPEELHDAVQLRDGRVVVAGVTALMSSVPTQFFELGEDLDVVRARTLNDPTHATIRSYHLQPGAGPDEMIGVGFQFHGLFQRVPTIMWCRVPVDGAVRCNVTRIAGFEGILTGAVTLSDSVVVAIDHRARLAILIPVTPGGQDAYTELVDVSKRAPVAGENSIAAIGRTVYTSENTVSSCEVYSAPIDRAAIDRGEFPARTLVATMSGHCRRITQTPGGNLRFASRSEAVELDANGAIAQRIDDLGAALGIGGTMAGLRSDYPGWIMATRTDGAVFRARSTDAALTRIYGATRVEDASFHTRAMTVAGGAVYALGTASRMLRVTPSGTRTPEIAEIAVAGLPEVDAAAPDSADGTIVAMGSHEVSRVDLSGSATTLALGAAFESGDRLLDIAEVSAGTHVLITQANRIIRLRGDIATPVDIEWDDPSTEVVEPMPTVDFAEACAPRSRDNPHPGGPPGSMLRAVDGGSGIGWVAGCPTLLLRVVAFAEPPYAERFAFAHADADLLIEASTETTEPDWTAVRAICPDSVVLAGPERPHEELGFLSPLVEVAPVDDTIVLRSYAGNDSVRITTDNRFGPPVALVGHGSTITGVWGDGGFGGGMHRFLGKETYILVAPAKSAAQTADGQLFVGSTYGRFSVTRVCN